MTGSILRFFFRVRLGMKRSSKKKDRLSSGKRSSGSESVSPRRRWRKVAIKSEALAQEIDEDEADVAPTSHSDQDDEQESLPTHPKSPRKSLRGKRLFFPFFLRLAPFAVIDI